MTRWGHDLDWLLSFGPAVVVEQPSPGCLVLRTGQRAQLLRDPSPQLVEVIRLLSTGQAGEAELSRVARTAAAANELSVLFYRLGQWSSRGWLRYGLPSSGPSGFRVQDTVVDITAEGGHVDLDVRYRLSRFSCLRRMGDELVIESPLAPFRIALFAEVRTAVLGLVDAVRGAEFAVRACLPSAAAVALLGLLVSSGMATPLTAAGAASEEDDADLGQWDVHDLAFHAATRRGLGPDKLVGAHFPRPELAEIVVGERLARDHVDIELPVPDPTVATGGDVSFTAVVERRRSIREYGSAPLSVAQLGEFLHRTAGGRREEPTEPEGGAGRPYPAAGGVYELELYVLVSRCTGLPTGTYHYLPARHGLRVVGHESSALDAVFRDAGASAAMSGPIQVLVAFSFRPARLAWKYSSIGYSLALKDVGVLMQSMYLVATAMDLAPCALGAGDSRLLARALGHRDSAEPVIGEFLLGSLPDGP